MVVKGAVIDGWKDFQRDLRRFEPDLARRFRAELMKEVRAVAEDAARRAPRRSGELAKGIKPSITQKDIAIVSRAPHAWIMERGGRHPVFGHDRWVFQPARPHVFPAVDAAAGDIVSAAMRALDKTIAEVT